MRIIVKTINKYLLYYRLFVLAIKISSKNYPDNIYLHDEIFSIADRLWDEFHDQAVAGILFRIGHSIFAFAKMSLVGDIREVVPYAAKALEYWHKMTDITVDEKAFLTCLGDLGTSLYMLGKYQESAKYFIEALEFINTQPNPDFQSKISALNNLGAIYSNTGEYIEAESAYTEAFSLLEEDLNYKHPNVVEVITGLSNVYLYQEKYDLSNTYLQKVIDVSEDIFTKDTKSSMVFFNTIGLLCLEKKQYDDALVYLTKSLDISKKILFSKDPSLARILINLSAIHLAKRNLIESKNNLEIALEIANNFVSGVNKEIVVCLNNLAYINYLEKKYAEALIYFQKALHICCDELGLDNSPYVIAILSGMGYTYVDSGDIVRGLSNLEMAIELENKILSRTVIATKERDRLHFLKTIKPIFNDYISLVCADFPQDNEVVKASFIQLLKRKCINLATITALNEAVHSGRYPHLKPELERLVAIGDLVCQLTIATDFNQPQYTSVSSTDELKEIKKQLSQAQAEFDELEKLLLTQLPELQILNDVSYESITSILPKETALIEFFKFDFVKYSPRKVTKEYYLAFVISSYQPDIIKIVNLGEAKTIDDLIIQFHSNLDSSVPTMNFVSSNTQVDNKIDIESFFTSSAHLPYHAEELYQLIYLPLSSHLGNAENLLIAPDSVLSILPFELLFDDENKVNLYKSIRYVSSAKDLLSSRFTFSQSAGNSLVIADPDYDLQESVDDKEAISKNRYASYKLERLKTTANLGKLIARKLNVKPYLQEQAVETLIRNSPCPPVLFLATHGMYLSEAELKIDNPLMRSMLAFAGANAWSTGSQIPQSAGKGWLFAQDIAKLNLWSNDLVILLACETGLGDIIAGEGVFGLRSAFVSAGAKSIIMSLWSVPINASVLLMEHFFDYLEQGLDTPAALKLAQNYVRNITIGELKSSDSGRVTLEELIDLHSLDERDLDNYLHIKPLVHPIYWGAWIHQGL